MNIICTWGCILIFLNAGYCFQAVDRFKHPHQPAERYREALEFTNLSMTKGMHGILSIFIGQRMRLTKKICPPELVQAATCTVIGISFHPAEQFGHPGSTYLRPADGHHCWKSGLVLCSHLPLHIEVLFDGCSQDYTDNGKPGVWYLEPSKDDWKLPIKSTATIDHPNAPGTKRVKMKAKKNATLELTRCQMALTPENPNTYHGWQGGTVKGPDGEPKGFVVDLGRKKSMCDTEYWQFLYMILGRARKLDWILLRNFPCSEDGSPDWTVFEQGLPDHLCEYMEKIYKLANETRPRLKQALRLSGMPAFDELPVCAPDPDNRGRFIYNPQHPGPFCRQDAILHQAI